MLFTGLTSAAHAACASAGTESYTCSGDFSTGLIVQDEVPSTTTTVTIANLTANSTFVTWEIPTLSSGATFTVETGSFEIGSSATELSAVSAASDIHNGKSGSSGDGFDAGGSGDAGGTGTQITRPSAAPFSPRGAAARSSA
jgi:hypothetical protein